MRKSYKQKYEELKKKVEVKESGVAKHTKNYIHSPKPNFACFIAIVGSVGLSIVNFMLIISTWKMLGLGDLEEESITGFNQLLVCYPLVFEYVFIGLAVVSLVAMIKGGFNKLKKYDEDGLIGGLIWGLIGGLIGGLIVGLIVGLIWGLIVGLIVGLIWGLIAGLISELE